MNCFFCGFYCCDNTRCDCPECGTDYSEKPIAEKQNIRKYNPLSDYAYGKSRVNIPTDEQITQAHNTR